MPQATRPVIGMNVDFVPASKTQSAHLRLHPGYAEAVLAAGGLPVVLPLYSQEAQINDFLDRVDGFLLTGAALDLDPRRQGLALHQAVKPMSSRREDADRILVRQLFERQLPTLGIGVGLHQLNIACGGTLYQHLPEELPRAMPHADVCSEGPHRHAVLLQPGTRLDEIYGGGELRVNSHHHQAVKTIGPRFKVCAVAPDGVIEAIEINEPGWFCVGVQWHPESETASALDMQLFESFVQASIRQAPPLALAG